MKTKYFFVLLIIMLTSGAAAQNHLLNPALKSTNTIYIGLPVISGITLNVTNNVFNFY
jgi:hypothetical protein